MSKKTTFLLILSILLLLFASCDGEVPTDAPTVAPTVEQTEAPTNAPTEVQTDEPTEAPTIAPTEACTHEWKNVSQCTHCEEIQTLADGDEQIRYDFSGAYKFLSYDRSVGWEYGKEVTNENVLDILNQGLWEKEVLTCEYDCKIAINNKILWYSTVRGVFANITDNRHLILNHVDRLTVNDIFTQDSLYYWHAWDSHYGRLELFPDGRRHIEIEDEQEKALLYELVSEAMENGTLEESSKGHYGFSYGLTFYWGQKTFVITILNGNRYSTSMHEDGEGYQYIYQADLSEIYNYIDEHYEEELWGTAKND